MTASIRRLTLFAPSGPIEVAGARVIATSLDPRGVPLVAIRGSLADASSLEQPAAAGQTTITGLAYAVEIDDPSPLHLPDQPRIKLA